MVMHIAVSQMYVCFHVSALLNAGQWPMLSREGFGHILKYKHTVTCFAVLL